MIERKNMPLILHVTSVVKYTTLVMGGGAKRVHCEDCNKRSGFLWRANGDLPALRGDLQR